MERNVARRNFAIEAEFEDIQAGQPTENRYVRVRTKIMEHFRCSRSSAERAIRAAELYLAEQFDATMPAERAKTCRQLQRIADKQETAAPQAAVAALREKSKILGLYAPKKLEVTHGTTPELALQLDAILAILDDAGRAAMDVVMGQIEAAQRDGRLALPAGDAADPDDDAEDAEIVEVDQAKSGGDPGEPGAN